MMNNYLSIPVLNIVIAAGAAALGTALIYETAFIGSLISSYILIDNNWNIFLLCVCGFYVLSFGLYCYIIAWMIIRTINIPYWDLSKYSLGADDNHENPN